MKNRYDILKKLYPEYLILFKKKDDYISINIDNKIIEYLKIETLQILRKSEVNYIILDNLKIIEQQNYEADNKYNTYYLRYLLISNLKKLKKRVIGL